MPINYFCSGLSLGIGIFCLVVFQQPYVGLFNLAVSLANFILARMGDPQ